MSSPKETALRHAQSKGVPLAYASGRLVVLVLEVSTIPGLGGMQRLQGRIVSRECTSAAHARAVTERVLSDLSLFSSTHTPSQVLAVSAQYAEAAYRHAMRRQRRHAS